MLPSTSRRAALDFFVRSTVPNASPTSFCVKYARVSGMTMFSSSMKCGHNAVLYA